MHKTVKHLEKDETIAGLRQRNRHFEKEKGMVVEEIESYKQKADENDQLERQLRCIKQQLEDSEQINAQFHRHMAELAKASWRWGE